MQTWYGHLHDEDLRPWQRRALALAAGIDRLGGAAAGLAMLLLLLLAILTATLVLLGAAGWVHNGLEELKWHLLGAVFLLGAAACLRDNGHVRVDTLYGRLPPRWRAGIDCLAMLLIAIPFCLLVLWYGGSIAWDSLQRGELSSSAGGLGARWLIRTVIPLGFGLLGLQALAVALRALVVLRQGVASPESA